MRNAYPRLLPLDPVARAVVGAYVALGEIDPAAGESLALTPREGGLVRCALTAGNSRENALLAAPWTRQSARHRDSATSSAGRRGQTIAMPAASSGTH